MRILIISPSFPYPPDRGGAIRIFNLIKQLSRDNEIDLLSIDYGGIGEQAVAVLKKYCKNVHLVGWEKESWLLQLPMVLFRLVQGKPFSVKYETTRELARLIHSITGEVDYDIVQFEHSLSADNLKYLNPASTARTVLSMHNIAAVQYRRIFQAENAPLKKMKLLLDWLPMARWEPKIAKSFDLCVTVSETDKGFLAARQPGITISVIPNGVDCTAFQPCAMAPDNRNIIFVGSLDYEPNIDAVLYFYREIFPLIIREMPDCTFTVVGKNPPEEIRELQRDPSVIVKANVDDVGRYYKSACVSLVPLRSGGGTRLKILESMAFGIPVVSTSVGCEGLDVSDGLSILLADAPEDFAQKVSAVISTPVLWNRLSVNGRKLVEEKYDWEVIAHQCKNIYEHLITCS